MTRIGTDIAYIPRFEKLTQHLKERLYTPYERSEAEKRAKKGEYFSSRFAAKEAYAKALGTGFDGITPVDIEVRNEDNGKPYLLIRGERKDNIQLSLSHDGDYSVAFVLIEDE